MLPDEVGSYYAFPQQWAVGEFEGRPTFDVNFRLTHRFVGGENPWANVDAALQITKRFFLIKKDGTWSKQLDDLRAALEWKGTTLSSLQNTDWSQTPVILAIGREANEQTGKSYIAVQFINHRDSDPATGGVSLNADPQVITNLDAKYGPMLRAKLGGNGAGAAAPTGPRPPVAYKGSATPKIPTTPAEAIQREKQGAWAAFKTKTVGMSEAERKDKFLESIAGYTKGKKPAECSIEDWTHVANSITEYGAYTPGAPAVAVDENGEPVLVPTNDDLPF
jgi:hypothetical protein